MGKKLHKNILILIFTVIFTAFGSSSVLADENTINVGPYKANLDLDILYGIAPSTSIWQFIENVYPFDSDITVTDEYGVVISGGDIFTNMQTMIDFDEEQNLKTIINGDVNMDNIIDENDIALIKKYILQGATLSPIEQILYDVNMDNSIDICDIVSIKNVINNAELSANPIVNSITMNYSYETMKSDALLLSEAYPVLCDVSVIGQSIFGRDIYAVRVGNPEAENHILIHGGIHGREHLTSMLIMDQAEYLMSKSQDLFNNKEIYAYLQNTCIHFIPMVNPDGIMLSQEGIESVPQEFKEEIPNLIAMSDNGDFSTWKANGRGIDLNRNFDGSYDDVSIQSPGASEPAFEMYGGEEYFTEPESIALRDYTLSYDFDITISYHSAGEIIFWFYNQEDGLLAVNYQLAATVGSITGYEVLGSDMPPTTSGYKDWAVQQLQIPSLTVETGSVKTPLPYSQYEEIYNANLILPLELIEFNGVYSIE